jgi:hypothetical protein
MGDAKKFLSTYCIDCYTGENPSGQREFATMDLTKDNWDTQWKLQEIIDQLKHSDSIRFISLRSY